LRAEGEAAIFSCSAASEQPLCSRCRNLLRGGRLPRFARRDSFLTGVLCQIYDILNLKLSEADIKKSTLVLRMSNLDDPEEKFRRDRLLHTCAWCNQFIDEESEAFGFGAKASPTISLEDKEGQFVSLDLALEDKTTFAMVPPPESPARQAGYDLMFITCSQSCAEELKNALELEKDVFEGD